MSLKRKSFSPPTASLSSSWWSELCPRMKWTKKFVEPCAHDYLLHRSALNSESFGPLNILVEVLLGYTCLATLQSLYEIRIFCGQIEFISSFLHLIHVSFEVCAVGIPRSALFHRRILFLSLVVHLHPSMSFIQNSDWTHQGVIGHVWDIRSWKSK